MDEKDELGSEWEDEDEEQIIEEEEKDEEEEIAPKINKNLQPKKSSLKQNTKSRKTPLEDLEDEAQKEGIIYNKCLDSVRDYYSSSGDESDQNPHGYVDPEKLSRFKKTKT